MLSLRIEKAKTLKEKPKDSELVFGTQFTDHMFVMDYAPDKGWHDPRIVPYGPLPMSPATMVFHYGQAIFEGLKAYRDDSGRVVTFRPKDNFARLNRSAARMCIPQFDEAFALEALLELLRLEKDWVPHSKDTSLYIRPFIIATDPYLGVRPSNTYKFMIILSPVGAYYPEGFDPVKIMVTDQYVRACKGGVGHIKAEGNYGASLYASKIAKEQGYTQVLWLDAKENRYVEEVGTMNIFFKIGGKLVTPTLESGSILPGITRDSVITLAKDMGVTVEERRISMDEICEASEKGTLEEVFGSGTAAVVSPVGLLHYKGKDIVVNGQKTGPFVHKMYDTLTGIQFGKLPDKHGWVLPIE
jgi:branched-chain amino acid aminotransferase